MSRADVEVMVNKQRLPLLPRNCSFSRTLTCDAVLVTAHHTTGFPFSNFCDRSASAFFTPRYRVLGEAGILFNAVTSNFRYLMEGRTADHENVKRKEGKDEGTKRRRWKGERGEGEGGVVRFERLDFCAIGSAQQLIERVIEIGLLSVTGRSREWDDREDSVQWCNVFLLLFVCETHACIAAASCSLRPYGSGPDRPMA